MTTNATAPQLWLPPSTRPAGEVYGLCQERHRHQEWLKFQRGARSRGRDPARCAGILVEAAQVATRWSPSAQRYDEGLLRKKHKPVARVALARKL